MWIIASFLFVLSAAGLSKGACDGKCEIPLTHYEEMGCKPVYKTEGDCCPSHFDCSSFEGRSLEKCFYKGEVYNKGDRVKSELTAGNCLAACFCSEFGKFTCAHIDCPEFLGARPLKPGCFRAYEGKSCCSVGNKCPPFEGLAKCEVNGKTYYEGQRFEVPEGAGPQNLKCICQKKIAGKFEAPFCTPISCGVEILHSRDFRNNCAPVYYGNKGLCPIQWQCNENVLSIQLSKENKKIDKKCKFTDKELNVGDKVILNKPYEGSPEIKCECLVPPVVTCIQTPHSE